MDKRQLPYYRLDVKEVLGQLKTSMVGLSRQEASARLDQHGPNELQRAKREGVVITFVKQFKNLLVLILLISACLSLYLHDFRTGTILFAIALVNASVSFIQEHRAEALLASLEKLVVPQAHVIRDGKLTEVSSAHLVPGDVVYVEAGDSVPADLRVIDEEELSTNDFALTGESNPSRKFVHAITGDVLLGNRHNILFMGTTVATGHGHGVVVGVGAQTELGRIANLSQATEADDSPLQREMNNLATRLSQGAIILAVILTIIEIRANLGLKDALLFAIGVGAAMVPNGLAAEVSITLAKTAGRMAKAHALVKKLSAVETLGATNVICTDKTGTLTKNEMTVERLLIGRTGYKVSGIGYEPNGGVLGLNGKPLTNNALASLKLFFSTGAMASNARVKEPDNEHATWYCVGDPTEGALITLARKAGIDPDALDNTYEEIKEFQFDSARKRMSSVRRYEDRIAVFTKGAPESVLECCTHVWVDGEVRPLTGDDRKFFLKYNEDRAQEAMRNLGFAYGWLPNTAKPKTMKFNEVEKGLIFMGIVSMVDPLREQVPDAMVAARNAHINVSIITGDYAATAAAIARRAKLAPEGQDVTIIQGEELPGLSDAQVLGFINQGGTVFSRVAPEDKLRIVELVKNSGQVVAVTGDGINDAPALKRADIGVAMGLTGTDVSKQASEMVLLDDSFHTLVGAIEQGRLTFKNIKKAARCALTDNAGELFAVLFGVAGLALFHIPAAITAVQILAIDLVAELFPIAALGWDKAQNDLMTEEPRNLKDHIINRRAVMEFLSYGLLSAGLAYANFLLFFSRHNVDASSVGTHTTLYAQATILTYVTLVLCQFVNLLIVRTEVGTPLLTSYLWSNKKLLLAFGFSFFCILNIVYNPVVRPYFGAGPLSIIDWLLAAGVAAVYLLLRMLLRNIGGHRSLRLIKKI